MRVAWIGLRVGLYMLWMLFDLWRGKRLLKLGRIAEKEALVRKVAIQWSHFCVDATKSTVTLIGEEHLPDVDEPLLIVANHQSAFDIPFILGYLDRPVGFISKIENRKIPLLGPWLVLGNCVFIERGNAREAVKSIAEGAKLLKSGYSQALFPEGTRSADGTLGPFKAGGFKLAEKAQVRILPVTIVGGNRLMPKGTFHITPQDIKLIIGKPVDMAGRSTHEVSEICREIIKDNLERYDRT